MSVISVTVPPPGITCPKYRQLPGTKRCQHYVDGGACGLDTEFMCVEWVKVNHPEQHAQALAHIATLTAGGIVEVSDLPSPPTPSAAEGPPPGVPDAFRGVAISGVPEELAGTPRTVDPTLLTPLMLAELERSGVEVEVSSDDLPHLWLVPSHTEQDRPELTFREAFTLLGLMSILPGATLRRFRRPALPTSTT